MKKMFISLLLITVLVLTNPPGSLHKTSDIPSSGPKTLIAIDFKSRLNQAEKELQNSRAGILKEVNFSEQDFNDFIKKNFNFYKDCFAQQIIKYKRENKFCKLTRFSEEISAELQKNPTIEIFAIDNLFGKYGSPGITIGQTIFLDSKFVDKPGIIMHEICHAINEDQIIIGAIDAFIDHHNKNTRNFKSSKLPILKRDFYQKIEKKADLWSAAHCKGCAKQLIDLFKSPGCRSTECHPDDATRIAYLS